MEKHTTSIIRIITLVADCPENASFFMIISNVSDDGRVGSLGLVHCAPEAPIDTRKFDLINMLSMGHVDVMLIVRESTSVPTCFQAPSWGSCPLELPGAEFDSRCERFDLRFCDLNDHNGVVYFMREADCRNGPGACFHD